MAGRTGAKATKLPTRQEPAWFVHVKDKEAILSEKPVRVEVVVQELKVGREKIYELIANEGLPASKMGNHWEFYLSLVRAWHLYRHTHNMR